MQVQNVVLVYRKENGTWQKRPLSVGSYIIGRSAQADIQFDEQKLSRQHLSMTVAEDGVSITDLNSSNGSYLNGTRLQPQAQQAITPDDAIVIGSFEIKVEWQAAPTLEEFVEQSTAPRPPEPFERTMLDAPGGGFLVVYQVPGENVVEHELQPGTYVIGRTASSDIQIPGTKVSRLHARLEVTATGCSLEDVGSSNGTFYLNSRMTPHVKVQLLPGSVFTVGDTEIRLDQVRVHSGASQSEFDATRLDESPKFTDVPEGATELEGVAGEATMIESTPEPPTQIDGLVGDATQVDGVPDEMGTVIEAPVLDSNATAIDAGKQFDADRTSIDAGRVAEPVGDVSNGVVLRFRRDNGEWDKLTLHPGEYIFGRSQEADLSIPDGQVSRRHVKLIVNAAEGCSIMDLGSANGSLLNGMPLQPRIPVPFGRDEILTIGGYEITLQPVNSQSMTNIMVGKTEVGEMVVGATEVVPSATAPILRYREGNGRWNELYLNAGEQVLGRSSEAQLQIPSSKMSRRHARFFVQGNQVWITDLNSKNGIVMNGQRIVPDQSVQLHPGARFSVDDIQFELVIGEETALAGQMGAFSGNLGPCILEPGKMDMLLNIPRRSWRCRPHDDRC